MTRHHVVSGLLGLAVVVTAGAGSRARSEEKPRALSPAVERATRAGIAALTSAQQRDGSLGLVNPYRVAVTSMAGLAVLAAGDDPLDDPLLRGAARFVRASQTAGRFPDENGTWVHVQGFATLFLAELYGRVWLEPLERDVPPELERDGLCCTVTQAVALLSSAQAVSGGWNYRPEIPGDEGSTTVCAVQALRAAKNFGIAVDPGVLARGFAYLKNMQNADGGFRYMGTSGASMHAGTAAAVATLVLMQKLDERVLFGGLAFLERDGLDGLASASCPRYGELYAAMAMKVLGDEYGEHLPAAAAWPRKLTTRLLESQEPGGSWPDAEIAAGGGYGTSLAVLSLACPAGRLSVFNRRAPRLPER